jgi:hypothetical protein
LSDHGTCLPAAPVERLAVAGGGECRTALATPARANRLTSNCIRGARADGHEVRVPQPAVTGTHEEIAPA